jgi:hypothetical protein
MKRKSYPLRPTETYDVKFSYQDPETKFWKRDSQIVAMFSKGKHKQAEAVVLKEYRKKGIPIQIISVTYQ